MYYYFPFLAYYAMLLSSYIHNSNSIYGIMLVVPADVMRPGHSKMVIYRLSPKVVIWPNTNLFFFLSPAPLLS